MKLYEKYGVKQFEATDNIIESKNLTPMLNEYKNLKIPVDIFYEIKANVTPGIVDAMRKAGIRRVQPGIESLSTNVLKLMKKGTSQLLNINALRWLMIYEVDPIWNVLYGFPEETVFDYESQANLIPLICHLPPPQLVTRISLDRFSPSIENPEARSKFENIRPEGSYHFTLPPEVDLLKAAYHFTGRATNSPAEFEYASFFEAIESWRINWKKANEPFSAWSAWRPTLSIWLDDEGGWNLDDRRKKGFDKTFRLNNLEKAVLQQFFSKPTSIDQAISNISQSGAEIGAFKKTFKRLVDKQLIVIEGNTALALPVISAPEVSQFI